MCFLSVFAWAQKVQAGYSAASQRDWGDAYCGVERAFLSGGSGRHRRYERDGVKTIKPAAGGKRSGEGRRHCPAGKGLHRRGYAPEAVDDCRRH